MMLKILYFASVRELLGQGSEELPLPAGVGDVAGLLGFLAQRGGAWKHLAEIRNLRQAVNQEMVGRDAPIGAGDEVAFFPPVTGG
ncbi:MAG: molybdopterin converting factor subunit 1 [Candidatus Accumulibacter phosphatis]|nr:molybdopterin converting factor subunit 1 [Candidatus Accumulibacter phosphatis]